MVQSRRIQDEVTTSGVHLVDAIQFQLSYLGSTRILSYRHYRFSRDTVFSICFVLAFAAMFTLHSLTLLNCADVTEFTDLMYVFGIQINELVKIYDICSQSPRIRRLLDRLPESRHQSPHPAHPPWRHSRPMLRAAQRHVRISSLLLYICASSSATMVFVSALCKHHTLPFASWFPLDTHKDRGYWCAYAVQLGYVFYLTPMNITLDTLLTGLMHFVAVQLDILHLQMLELGGGRGDDDDDWGAAGCERVVQELGDVIRYHQEIMHMIKEIEEIFNRGIFVQCITCVSTLCIVGYRILIVEPLSNDFFAMVLILTAFLGEIFYYCHYGNEIKEKAERLYRSVYVNRWYQFRCRCAGAGKFGPHRRKVLMSITIIMERIKRPTYVTAGKLVKLSYETFIAICKGGFQAFTVLRDMQLG